MNNENFDLVTNDENEEFTVEFGEVINDGGTRDYNELDNQPQINGHTLEGNKTNEQLGIPVYTEGTGIKLSGNTISADTDVLATKADLNSKQNVIADLPQIRSGAEAGATAVQPEDLARIATTGSYNDSLDKPSVNNVALIGNISLDALGIQPKGNYALESEIPDVSNFITNTVDNLVNYYKKSETFTKQEVNDLISAITTMDIQVVQTLPTEDISTTTIYFVPKTTAGTSDVYDEYVYVSNAWEHIGSTDIDLSGYQTKIDSSHKLSSDLVDDSNQTNKFVTENEKTTWDNKASGIINTQSGDVVQIKDGANNKEVISLDVDINANQNLHGYEYPWAGGEGKNLLDPSKVSVITAYGLTITFSNNVFSISGTPTAQSASLAFNIVDYSDYSLSGKNYVIQALEISGTPIKSIYGFRTEQEKRIAIMFDSVANPTINTTFKLSVSTTSQTVWSPYENICPITGWTGATISQSGEDTSNPTTRNISWQSEAGIVYGGTLDVISGVLTVTDQNIASYNGENLPSTWISDRDVYSVGETPTIGAQVVYKLATPATYQLPPQEIKTVLGINNIWSNTGDVTVNYKADTKLYIDNKFQSLEDRLTLLEG